MYAGIEIVEHPLHRESTAVAVTPGGLFDALIATAGTTRAVRFPTDKHHFLGLLARVKSRMRKKGYAVRYSMERPHSRRHREYQATFFVVMWLEEEEEMEPQEQVTPRLRRPLL